ncbi:MAG: YhdP family protein [Gammaproteobacteria bacterium]
MDRVNRRWWTLTLPALALLVVLGAVASGAFQLAILMLPSYRDDVAAWVSESAGRPVQLGGIHLGWSGIFPRLELTDMSLFTRDGSAEIVSVQRLSLGFSLTRLLAGNTLPSQVDLTGMDLAIETGADGSLRLSGLESPGPGTAAHNWLAEFARFRRVRLYDCALQVQHPRLGAEPQRFLLREALLARSTLGGFEAQARLQLPPALGQELRLDARVRGELTEPGAWQGRYTVQASALQPQAWLAPWLAADARIEAQDLGFTLSGTLIDGRPDAARFVARAGALLAQRGTRTWQARSSEIQLQLTALEAQGWRVALTRFVTGDEPQARAALLHVRPGRSGREWALDAEELRLDTLAPWASLLADVDPRIARLRGALRDVVLRWRQHAELPDFSFRAQLANLSGMAEDDTPGFSGLGGELATTAQAGRLTLDGERLALTLPGTLASAVPFEQFRGELQWLRRDTGWQLRLPDFGWQLLGSQGQGQLLLSWPQDGEPPHLELDARFSARDVTRLKPFIPLRWGAPLRAWLQRAIEQGEVTRGELRIHGPLADFPYHQRQTGEWKLDLDASGLQLAYAPDWPAVTGLDAQLQFRGNGLGIESRQATVLGARAESVSARIEDFRAGQLDVQARVTGQTEAFYEILRQSPLREPLSGLLTQTRTSGPASVNLRLAVPLKRTRETRVNGQVTLDNVELAVQGLSEPVQKLRGQIEFDNRSLRAQELRARLMGAEVTARILPREGASGLLQADFTPNLQAPGVAALIPGWLRPRLSGSSRWRAELALGTAEPLQLSTSLEGTALDLPAPLGKPAELAAPLTLRLGAASRGPRRLQLDYHQRLGADAVLVRRDEQWSLRALELQLGGPAARAGNTPGIFIGGQTEILDLLAWRTVLGGLDAGGLPLRGVALGAERVVVGRQRIHQVTARWTPTPSGWTLNLDGAGANGQIVRDRAADSLRARLAYLTLDPIPVTQSAHDVADTPRTVLDPLQYPQMDLQTERLRLGDAEIGAVSLLTRRVPGGQQLERLEARDGVMQLSASGEWLRGEGGSQARLDFELRSPEIASLLVAFGFAPSLEARDTQFAGELTWPLSDTGVAWQQAAGDIRLKLQNGTLRTVEPGAGRVLGLVNFYALPRRLILDFRDVVSKGLGFDQIEGRFRLGNGVASTDNLSIRGPSLRMEVSGDIGLAARDYNQTVRVYPDMSSGVTLGAALLGGPAVGALVLLAQELLQKPLDQVTQFGYRVTGSWDNPQISKLEPANGKDG